MMSSGQGSPTALAASSDTPTKTKRSSIACTRCRQLRVRCIHDGQPPCVGCSNVQKQDDCIFPPRGTSLHDRAPRGIRKRRKKNEQIPGVPQQQNPQPEPAQQQRSPTRTDTHWSLPVDDARSPMLEDDGLPPREEIMEGAEAFFSGYFQLGFIHRPTFMHNLETNPESVNQFLLMSMLAISARFTPSLSNRYGGPCKASDYFSAKAHAMVMEEMVSPSLERLQALYILGVNDWGRGLGFRSKMLTAMTLQMAELINLHQEDPESNALELESRRRTWWFVLMNSNLHSIGAHMPKSFHPLEAPIPLPSHEEDFAFGCISTPPTYFPGSKAEQMAREHGNMSLLGALLTIVTIWGKAARVLCGLSEPEPPVVKNAPPWRNDSLLEFTGLDMHAWLARLSNKQKWSTRNLLAYKDINLDLAFYGIFVNFHVLHIALRRQHLPNMIRALHPSSSAADLAYNGEYPPNGAEFWARTASEMIQHANDLLDLQSVVSMVRIISAGGTPFMGYGVYLAGTIMNYLRCCPWLCPERAPYAARNLGSALELLHGYTQIWAMSTRWYDSLSAQAAMHQGAGPELARHDISLDKRVGIYRQFASDERTELYSPRQTPGPGRENAGAAQGGTPMAQSQLDAASTLAQLSGAVVGRVSMPPHGHTPGMQEMPQQGPPPPPEGYQTTQMDGSEGNAQMPPMLNGIFTADHFESDLSAFLTGDVDHGGVGMQFTHY